MNEVASLELSRELYEVSGWGEGQKMNWWIVEPARTEDDFTYKQTEWIDDYPDRANKEFNQYAIPAYSLGYLMRKLPYNSVVMHHQESMGWIAENSLYMVYGIVSDTPENATAKLAIELFKQGILTKETN